MPKYTALRTNTKTTHDISALDAGDIALLKTYGVGPYTNQIKQVEADIQSHVKKVNELIGWLLLFKNDSRDRSPTEFSHN